MRLPLFIIIIALAATLSAETTAPQSTFKADVTLSSQSIALTDQLNVHVSLTFPNTYHPNIDQIKSSMLEYNGLQEPPFYLMNSSVNPAVENNGIVSQEVILNVTPQMPGKHFLTLQLIRFDPNAKGPSVQVPTDIFEVEVSVPTSTFNREAAMAPPMSFSKVLPITISAENQREFQHSPEGDRITAALQQRVIPWILLVSIVAVIITVILIRALKGAHTHIKDDPLLAERLRHLSLEELQNLVAKQPGKEESPNAYFLRLDGALRKYLDTTYHLDASASTAQELAIKTDALPGINTQVRKQIGKIFLQTDQIKFAHATASQNDLKEAIKAVSLLINV